MQLLVRTDGRLEFIYTDDLHALLDEGTATILRVSNVEPTSDGRWEANLAPVGGPVLGPFVLRQQALDAEIKYLNNNVL